MNTEVDNDSNEFVRELFENTVDVLNNEGESALHKMSDSSLLPTDVAMVL